MPFGLIPACAGKTWPGPHLSRSSRAHPRVCGENFVAFQATSSKTGSSPRVRGKLAFTPYASIRRGLIPACAGKTHFSTSSSSRLRAHPRVCGENLSLNRQPRAQHGSSPRVRGKHQEISASEREGGLIPACAGKTSPRQRAAARTKAHPRVCGENRLAGWVGPCAWGSSPRVRGKPSHYRH